MSWEIMKWCFTALLVLGTAWLISAVVIFTLVFIHHIGDAKKNKKSD